MDIIIYPHSKITLRKVLEKGNELVANVLTEKNVTHSEKRETKSLGRSRDNWMKKTTTSAMDHFLILLLLILFHIAERLFQDLSRNLCPVSDAHELSQLGT